MLDFGPRQLLLGLFVSVAVGNSVIFFSGTEDRATFSELVTIIAASSAVLLAAAIAFRQNASSPHWKTYLSLAIGLVLWLCADVIWASYELYYHIAAPIPSVSDFLWLAGYPFFVYNLFKTYNEFKRRTSRRILLASIIGNAIFLGYLIPLTVNLSDLSSQAGWAMFAIIISYPIANAILTIPALPLLVGLWKDKPWSIPWTFKALSLFCIVVTDSWFALIVITGLQEQVWLSSMLFGAEYLIMASGLIWYNRFLPQYAGSHGPTSAISQNHKVPGTKPSNSRSNKHPADIIVATILVATVVVYGAFASTGTGAAEVVLPEHGNATLTIGALLPLTGTLASFGESSDAALRIGLADVNRHFEESGSATRIALVIEDTKTNPVTTLQKIKELDARGARIVIGPATSTAVAAVKDYADEHGILLISPSSTAPQLAIEGDNLFRFVPEDSHQADALARKMWDEGIRVVVPMWRMDLYGQGLHSAMKTKFEQIGGEFVDGVGYKAPTGDFAASLHRINFIFWEQDLKLLSSEVSNAIAHYGADKVGVYVVSYDEIVPIMIQAERHPDLASVRWYGSDGSAQNAALVHNNDAASFAAKTSFVAPIYGVHEGERFIEISHRITEKIGYLHRSYAEISYDALWAAALASDNAGPALDPVVLRNTLQETLDTYDGVTGRIVLDDAGDRAVGLYDFWTVKRGDDHYEWSKAGTGQSSSKLHN